MALINSHDVPMEFRCRIGEGKIGWFSGQPGDYDPDGCVAFYMIKNGIETGMSYDNVNELINDFENVLKSAKQFKEKWDARSNRGNS